MLINYHLILFLMNPNLPSLINLDKSKGLMQTFLVNSWEKSSIYGPFKDYKQKNR